MLSHSKHFGLLVWMNTSYTTFNPAELRLENLWISTNIDIACNVDKRFKMFEPCKTLMRTWHTLTSDLVLWLYQHEALTFSIQKTSLKRLVPVTKLFWRRYIDGSQTECQLIAMQWSVALELPFIGIERIDIYDKCSALIRGLTNIPHRH